VAARSYTPFQDLNSVPPSCKEVEGGRVELVRWAPLPVAEPFSGPPPQKMHSKHPAALSGCLPKRLFCLFLRPADPENR
jgi:hypothetical protein